MPLRTQASPSGQKSSLLVSALLVQFNELFGRYLAGVFCEMKWANVSKAKAPRNEARAQKEGHLG